MADRPQQPRKIQGDNEPEPQSVTQAAFSLAEGLLREREDRKAAIKEISRGFPLLYHFIRYSEGLGWRGTISKRWRQFSEVYSDFMQIASLIYDKYGPEYEALFGDHPREERLWFMMCDKLRNMVEDVNALLIEMMPEMKREIELDTESKERMTFFEILSTQEGVKSEGRTSTKMRRALETLQYEKEEE